MLTKRCLSLPALLLPVAALMAGCGQKSTLAPCKVEGSIKYKGKPIPAGIMNFVTPDGTAYGAILSEDGTYTATGIPEGEMIVTIDTEGLSPDAKAASGKFAAAYEKQMGSRTPPEGIRAAPTKTEVYVKIPAKYAKAKTSPLTVNLKPGRNVHEFDLTD